MKFVELIFRRQYLKLEFEYKNFYNIQSILSKYDAT